MRGSMGYSSHISRQRLHALMRDYDRIWSRFYRWCATWLSAWCECEANRFEAKIEIDASIYGFIAAVAILLLTARLEGL